MVARKRLILLGVPVLFVLIQLVPYGRLHDNPPVVREPGWANPETRLLAKRGCFECHSNETEWPIYAYVAPLSWFIRYDVAMGREKLNFSVWTNGAREGERPDVIRRAIVEGEMEHSIYRLLHPKARLSGDEMTKLLTGLLATASAGRPAGR